MCNEQPIEQRIGIKIYLVHIVDNAETFSLKDPRSSADRQRETKGKACNSNYKLVENCHNGFTERFRVRYHVE